MGTRGSTWWEEGVSLSAGFQQMRSVSSWGFRETLNLARRGRAEVRNPRFCCSLHQCAEVIDQVQAQHGGWEGGLGQDADTQSGAERRRARGRAVEMETGPSFSMAQGSQSRGAPAGGNYCTSYMEAHNGSPSHIVDLDTVGTLISSPIFPAPAATACNTPSGFLVPEQRRVQQSHSLSLVSVSHPFALGKLIYRTCQPEREER